MSIRGIASALVVAGSMFAAASASAMPVGSLAAAADEVAVKTDNVRWVCGPYRCFWRPNIYYGGPVVPYGFYGGPRFRYGYGYGPRFGYGPRPYGFYGRRW